ncbi:MAG: hypothetical protein ACYTGZ_10835 [Planctomycetota bacterium]
MSPTTLLDALTVPMINVVLIVIGCLLGSLAVFGDTWKSGAPWWAKLRPAGWLTIVVLGTAGYLEYYKELLTAEEARIQQAEADAFERSLFEANEQHADQIAQLKQLNEQGYAGLSDDMRNLQDAIGRDDKDEVNRQLQKMAATIKLNKTNADRTFANPAKPTRGGLASSTEFALNLQRENTRLRRRADNCDRALANLKRSYATLRSAATKVLSRFGRSARNDRALASELERLVSSDRDLSQEIRRLAERISKLHPKETGDLPRTDPKLKAAFDKLEGAAIRTLSNFGIERTANDSVADKLTLLKPSVGRADRDLAALRRAAKEALRRCRIPNVTDANLVSKLSEISLKLPDPSVGTGRGELERLQGAARNVLDRFGLRDVRDDQLSAGLEKLQPPRVNGAAQEQLKRLQGSARTALGKFGQRDVRDDQLSAGLERLQPPRIDDAAQDQLKRLQGAARATLGRFGLKKVRDEQIPEALAELRAPDPRLGERYEVLVDAAVQTLGRFGVKPPSVNDVPALLNRLRPGDARLEEVARSMVAWFASPNERERPANTADALAGFRGALPNPGREGGRAWLERAKRYGAEAGDATTALGRQYRQFKLRYPKGRRLADAINEFGEHIGRLLNDARRGGAQAKRFELEVRARDRMRPVVLGLTRDKASNAYWSLRARKQSRYDALRNALRGVPSQVAAFERVAGRQAVEAYLADLEKYPLGWRNRSFFVVK